MCVEKLQNQTVSNLNIEGTVHEPTWQPITNRSNSEPNITTSTKIRSWKYQEFCFTSWTIHDIIFIMICCHNVGYDTFAIIVVISYNSWYHNMWSSYKNLWCHSAIIGNKLPEVSSIGGMAWDYVSLTVMIDFLCLCVSRDLGPTEAYTLPSESWHKHRERGRGRGRGRERGRERERETERETEGEGQRETETETETEGGREGERVFKYSQINVCSWKQRGFELFQDYWDTLSSRIAQPATESQYWSQILGCCTSYHSVESVWMRVGNHSVLASISATSTDLKRIKTQLSLFRDFGLKFRADKTFTTRWPGGKVSAEGQRPSFEYKLVSLLVMMGPGHLAITCWGYSRR